MKKVAMVGGGNSYAMAPYEDHSWEIWSLNTLHERGIPRYDCWFELHELETTYAGAIEHREWLKAVKCPVYMQFQYDDIPNCSVYPFLEIKSFFQKGWYHSCTFTWMLALAIYKGYKEIGIWGMEAKGDTYLYQIPCIEYWLGYANGVGIDVYLHESSSVIRPGIPYPLSYHKQHSFNLEML